MHQSAPVTIELPPLVNGDQLRLAFITLSSEDYLTQDQGRTPAQVELGMESDSDGAMHDYVPIPSVEALDKLITDLRRAATTLEQWRHRLPSAA